MSSLLDPALTKVLEKDREWLSQTEVPIITISATFREELKQFYHATDMEMLTKPDIVFSRAHFSMAAGLAITAWNGHLNHKKAWMADPTNFVTPQKWRSIQFTESVGKTLARNPLLKQLKDLIDQFGRNKLPILDSITPPLLYLTEKIDRPIVSFHISAGNILAEHGKRVIQIVTDPHVRYDYLSQAYRPNISFCVFDERTKVEFLEQAAVHNIQMDPQRVIVTGPPVDPRIIAARQKKAAWRSGHLHLCVTTGGLGTNKAEIQQALRSLLPTMRKHPMPYHLIVYAGTQRDIAQMARALAHEYHVSIGEPTDHTAHLRILYSPHILDANEMLIHQAFPWAHGFITKPSGDMAYDAVAAGCFLLTFQEWGVWEERIREIFEQKDIARRADPQHLAQQLQVLTQTTAGHSWVERAMNHAFNIEKLFLLGNTKILEAVKAAEK